MQPLPLLSYLKAQANSVTAAAFRVGAKSTWVQDETFVRHCCNYRTRKKTAVDFVSRRLGWYKKKRLFFKSGWKRDVMSPHSLRPAAFMWRITWQHYDNAPPSDSTCVSRSVLTVSTTFRTFLLFFFFPPSLSFGRTVLFAGRDLVRPLFPTLFRFGLSLIQGKIESVASLCYW